MVLAGAVLCGSAFNSRADCIDDAAHFHHVNARLVRVIATIESGQHSNAVHLNPDGTTDIGLMQINSRWLATLSRFGISRMGLYDRCTNAYIGAWILSQNIHNLGLTWDAIGAYNAGTHAKRISYARRVYRALLTAPPSSSTPVEVPPVQDAGLVAKLFRPIAWGATEGAGR